MPYRLLIFDFDGTLADTFAWFKAAVPGMIARHRLNPVSEAEMEALRGAHGREVMARFGVRWWQLPVIAADMRLRMAKDAHTVSLFPGVTEALDALHAKGVKMAVVSSNAEGVVRAVLADRQALIAKYACGAGVFGKHAHFRRVLAQTRLAPADVIAIGDELRDLDAARQVGLAFGAVSWGYTKAEALCPKADHAFHRPADWVELCD